MISEFQDLSDKIERLAELVGSLRRENAVLRQTNKLLSEENMAFVERLGEAQRRVEAVIAQLPAPQEDDAETAEDAEPVDSEATR
ncbi:hypothetical protein G4G28_20015 [Massilia sp. Dwa41.01b]|uniref:hypothetical protein n=1 Tax=unclassified Massilia TaxID=2609279 RepID=UPI001600B16A|nr:MULTISPECIES: hypothetical protein [unclassified Massilia]QNA90213.1 hypothetical protein G4G28_20015 [Massilia sp. Dwa41.01b]QNB01100.1 hypothetical protein G4G31_23615 [Massilia sp. Se16.2.3]